MQKNFDQTFFVTGMQRSGTTLIEKLLSSHPQVSLLSQPFPYLFLEAKRNFLFRYQQKEDPYPLGPLFLEDRYPLAAFTNFLTYYQCDVATLKRLFKEMADFPGQYTRFAQARLEEVFAWFKPGNFFTTIAQLYRVLAHHPDSDLVGGKETLCEEFLPHVLEQGGKVLLLIRDPRDVITSLNYGKGREYAGAPKPLLFNLRHWRKSVAYALHLQAHPKFMWLRYEDLVTDPVASLNRVATRFKLSEVDVTLLAGGIRDQTGTLWEGNSSHFQTRNISQDSIGLYQRFLPRQMVSYIEAICYPELHALRYPCSVSWETLSEIIHTFRDSSGIERLDLSRYTVGPHNAEQECRRLALLLQSPSLESCQYFLFPRAQNALRQAVLHS